MNMKKKVLAAAIGASLGLGVAANNVQAAGLTSLVITGGTFAMGVFTGTPNPITDTSGANLIAPAIAPTFDTTVAQGSAAASSPIAWDFNLGGTWVNSFTTGPSSGSTDGAGGISGTIVITDNWNANNFDQGGAFTGTATGTELAGTFAIDWTSAISGGPFDGQVGTYAATGTYSAVPVPAAAWLFGSGLVGLVGVARRRRKAA